MIWTVSRVPVTCGAVPDCRIAPDEPIALFAGGRVRRCAAHAAVMGYELDVVEVEHERWRVEREMQRQASARLRRADEGPQFYPPPPPRPALPAKPRKPQPSSFFDGLFDPKSAAAGDRDE